MRSLLREAGLEDEVEVDSAGTGDWHLGEPPDARATAAAARARHRARRRRRGRSPRATSSASTCCWPPTAARWTPLRELAPDARGARARSGCCASSTPPRTTPDVARPLLRGRLRRGRRHRRGRLPRAARRGAVSLDVVVAPAGRRRRHQRGLAGRAGRRPQGVRQDAPRRARRRVRHRGRRAGLAGRAGRAARAAGRGGRRRVPGARVDRERRGSTATARRSSAAGWPACTPRGAGVRRSAGAPAGGRRDRPAAARPARAAQRAAAGLAVVLRRAAPAAAAPVARSPPSGRARGRARCASGCPSSPARPSRPRACTATCGAATCCRAPTGGPWLIDPAAYGGHREVDLAMLRAVRLALAAHPRRLRGGRAARRRPRGARRAVAALPAARPRRAVRRRLRRVGRAGARGGTRSSARHGPGHRGADGRRHGRRAAGSARRSRRCSRPRARAWSACRGRRGIDVTAPDAAERDRRARPARWTSWSTTPA